jgi:hypothetical protein
MSPSDRPDVLAHPRAADPSADSVPPPRRSLISMELRIADTFTDSLARHTGDEQKAVKTTAFDLQMNPAAPGGAPFRVLDEGMETGSGAASLCTMLLGKGLKFWTVVVMACDDEVIPLQERMRHRLNVACTRARDHLLVTGVSPASEFLDDLGLASTTVWRCRPGEAPA